MGKTATKIMDPWEFGKKLLMTGDIDPVYIILHESDLSHTKLMNWLMAYWCFYHVGTASWIVDQPRYWLAMNQAAGSSKWPRCSERRHFRGQKAVDAVHGLSCINRHAQNIIENLYQGDNNPTLGSISAGVQTWPMFGPWIAFKVADMLEALGLCDVDFKQDDVFDMFEAPTLGAKEMYNRYRDESGGDNEEIPEWAYRRLMDELSGYAAPPSGKRTINIQEIETILCKWKSHLNGHYEPGHDTKEIRKGLALFGGTPTVQKLYRAGKSGGLW